MVGCFNKPTADEAKLAEQTGYSKIQSLSSDIKKPPSPKDSLNICLPELEDFPTSFSDSFLDFDSNSWFVEGQPELCSVHKMSDSGEFPVGSGPDRSVFRASVEGLEMGGDLICHKNSVGVELGGGVTGQEKCETGGVTRSEVVGRDLVDKKVMDEGILSRGELYGNSVVSGCSIDEHLGKVSLDEALSGSIVLKIVEDVDGKIRGVNDVDSGELTKGGGKSDVMDGSGSGLKNHESANDKGGDSSDDSESEDESSSSSSSSSSGSDDEEEHGEDCGDMAGGKTSGNKKGRETDVEEGEILLSDATDEMAGWSDNENDEDGGSGTAGPVTSKNELKILPPVPSITVTLQPHHHTLPVGIILSILGAQVIVEGIEKHNPLNEGSILWITESRSSLGIIDEIFGPVKNPYYVVRYNFESEVPSNIQQGTSISFVPEFANHVLNDKLLYQKGYDASGENDEELSDELEFSDDEKEAEYKKMLKMNKRGTSDSKSGAKRKDKRQFKNQPGYWKSNQVPSKTPNFRDKIQVTESLNNGSSAGRGLVFSANQAIVPPLPVQASMPGFYAPNGIWGNGFLGQPPPSTSGLSGVPAAGNFMQWMQQNQPPFQFHQMPPVQNSTISGLPFNFSSSVDQANFVGVPAFTTPWLGLPNHNVFNQSSAGMGSQIHLPQNVVAEVFQCDGSQVSNSLQLSPVNSGDPWNFSRARGGGRRGHHRGGRQYSGRRGTSLSR